MQPIAVAAPTLMVLVGILVNNVRLSDMNLRLSEFRGEMTRRFDEVDERLASLAKVWGSELARVRDRVEAIERR